MYSLLLNALSPKHFKLAAILLLALHFTSETFGQPSILEKRITVQLDEVRLSDAIVAIEEIADCSIAYSETFIDTDQVVSIHATNTPLSEIMAQLFGELANGVQARGNQISIQPSRGKGEVSGTVQTRDGQPIGFATISIRGQGSTQADEQGRFTLRRIEAGTHTVTANHVGLQPQQQQIRVIADAEVSVALTFQLDARALQEVEVTGQQRKVASLTKMETALIDLPMSVQLVDQQLIHQQQIIDVRDAVKNASGVVMGSTYAGAYINLNGRGFEMLNWSNFRRNGMFIWNMGHHYNDNIERIEILKGPASFLFGDVSPGATINFVTKKPLPYNHRRFELKVGEHGLVRPTFDVGGALNEKNTVRYRLNATYEQSRSFIDEVRNETIMFSPAITWEISPDLTWDVEASFKNDDRTFNWGLVSPDGTFEGLKKLPVSRFLGEPSNLYRFKDVGAFSTLNYRLSDALRIKNTTYYTNTQRVAEGMYYPNPLPDENGDFVRMGWATSAFFNGWGNTLDIQAKFHTGPVTHQVVFGGDYMTNVSDGVPVVSYPFEPINIYRPEYGLTDMLKNPGYPGVDYPQDYFQRYGFFVQDQLRMLDERLQILLGIRYNVSENGTRYTDTNPAPDGYKTYRLSPLSPRLGLLFKVKPNLSLYGSYTSSYEMNEIDFLSQKPVGETTSYQYEFGVKTNLLRERLGIGLTAFQIDKKNVFGYVWDIDEEPDFPYFSYNPEVRAASYIGGHHRSKGIELDINGRVTDNLNVNIASSWIDAYIIDDPAFPTGNKLAENARFTLNAWANYAFGDGQLRGFELGYGFFFKDRFYGSNNNDPEELVSAFWTMDASVAYRYKQFGTRLNVSNFTNNIGYLGGWGVYQPQYVRRAVLSVSYSF